MKTTSGTDASKDGKLFLSDKSARKFIGVIFVLFAVAWGVVLGVEAYKGSETLLPGVTSSGIHIDAAVPEKTSDYETIRVSGDDVVETKVLMVGPDENFTYTSNGPFSITAQLTTGEDHVYQFLKSPPGGHWGICSGRETVRAPFRVSRTDSSPDPLVVTIRRGQD